MEQKTRNTQLRVKAFKNNNEYLGRRDNRRFEQMPARLEVPL